MGRAQLKPVLAAALLAAVILCGLALGVLRVAADTGPDW